MSQKYTSVLRWKLTSSVGIIVTIVVVMTAVNAFAASITRGRSLSSQTLALTTWSIVAADPVSGDVGLAAASCVPNVFIDAVAALVPGKGAAAIQAQWDLENRNRVFEMLQSGKTATTIVQEMTVPQIDASAAIRQYGIVSIHGGGLDVAAFTGAANKDWAGDQQDPRLGVTVQGNLLVDEAVVQEALSAYQRVDEAGFNTMPDRLIRALEAGSAAGGDARCNNNQVRQTASSAVILVARGGDPAYAAEDIGLTDAGTQTAPWLDISITGPRYGSNPVVELRRQYDDWRLENIGSPGDRDLDRSNLLIISFVVFLAMVLLGLIMVRKRAVDKALRGN